MVNIHGWSTVSYIHGLGGSCLNHITIKTESCSWLGGPITFYEMGGAHEYTQGSALECYHCDIGTTTITVDISTITGKPGLLDGCKNDRCYTSMFIIYLCNGSPFHC